MNFFVCCPSRICDCSSIVKTLPREVGVKKITWENELSWAGCSVGRKVWWSTSRNLHSVNLLHPPTHSNPPNCHLYFCLCQAFLWPNTHTHKRVRKWPVWLPNKLMCHAFSSDISAKAQERGCSTAPLLPLLLPLSWWHTVVTVTHLALLYEFAALVVGDAASVRAMSRSCVVKVITLTEIQLLQVGGATQLRAEKLEEFQI